MPAIEKKHQYATIAPVTPKGKWTVVTRRVGSRDRFAPYAETRCETAADNIVTALNKMQGDIVKLEVPAERALEDTRRALSEERKRVDAIRSDLRNEQNAHQRTKQDFDTRTSLVHTRDAEIVRLRETITQLTNQIDRLKTSPNPALVLDIKERADVEHWRRWAASSNGSHLSRAGAQALEPLIKIIDRLAPNPEKVPA